MRVAPVALVATSPHHAAELAVRSAELTHAHKHGQHGAACQAVAVYLALTSDPSRPLDATQFVHDLSRVVRSAPWHEKFDRIAELARRQAGPEHAARALGNDVSALGSVPLAVLAFLRQPDQPAEVIHFAIRAGGDTDTVAAMAGAIAGARNGTRHPLPSSWIDRLEVASRLIGLADRLS
jgi:poly(ADP-ribose) glycohydrolase ARH3